MKKLVPYSIAAVSGLFFLWIVIDLPDLRFLGIDWGVMLLICFGFLTFKILRWSQGLIGEIPA